MNGIIRQVIRVLLWRGLYSGIRRLTTWWGNRAAHGQSKEAAKATRDQAQKTGKNANRLVRILRRFSRF